MIVKLPPRAHRETTWEQLRWLGKDTLHQLPFGRVFACADGTVVFLIAHGEDNEIVVPVDASTARKVCEAISHATGAAAERVERLAGRYGWHAVERNGDRVLIEAYPHRGYVERRWFKPTKLQPRRHRGVIRPDFGMARCDACRKEFAPGDIALKEADPKPWASPNWRNVRLHFGCVITRRDGVQSIAAGKKTGVA